MENFTSTPFSMRDSGSAFINQYERPESSSSSASSSSALASADSDFSSGVFSVFSVVVLVPFGSMDFLGRPRPLPDFGASGLEVTTAVSNRRVTMSEARSRTKRYFQSMVAR